MVLVVVCEGPVIDSHVAVEGEAEVADASCFALLHEPVEQSVVEVSLVYRPHATTADAVQEEVVDVVSLKELEATLEHGFAFLEVVLRGREVGQLRSDEVVASLVSACLECDAEALFTFASAVGGRRVEVVDTVVEGELAESVHLFLVDGVAFGVLLGACAAVFGGWESHPAVAEQADLVALLRVGAIGHLVGGDGTVVVSHVIDLTVGVAALYAAGCQSSRGGCRAGDFEEVSSVYFLHYFMVFVITL